MIDAIKNMGDKEARKMLVDFMDVYLQKGFGVMNKTEIETLMYYVFKKHGLMSGKCFYDSLKLQIPEARARKLIYESQVKYDHLKQDDLQAYLRKSVGELLKNAFISKNGKEIRFAVEDKYLRVALNAELRSKNYFADTSFNKDIVALDEKAFTDMISFLVPNFQKDLIIEKVTAINLDEDVKVKEPKEFLVEVVKEIMVTLSAKGLSQLVGCLIV